jgi:hypothetical protein
VRFVRASVDDRIAVRILDVEFPHAIGIAGGLLEDLCAALHQLAMHGIHVADENAERATTRRPRRLAHELEVEGDLAATDAREVGRLAVGERDIKAHGIAVIVNAGIDIRHDEDRHTAGRARAVVAHGSVLFQSPRPS